jgi:ornithine cyclodeaminase/alanine dehydrogenase-like protein (mu-crystallin family)
LTAAKAKATKMQMFQGTVLIIENEDGARLAIKEGNTWTNF